MKYYSEILDQAFDSEKECLEQERRFKDEKRIKDRKLAEEKAAISRDKKYLSDKIEEANKKLEEANEAYKLAQNKAAEILEESNKQVQDILDNAKALVKQAEKDKLEAITAFNNKYGAYTTTVTGEKAINEFNKAIDQLRNDWPFFRFFDRLFF